MEGAQAAARMLPPQQDQWSVQGHLLVTEGWRVLHSPAENSFPPLLGKPTFIKATKNLRVSWC